MKRLNFACGDDIREGWDNCDWQESKKIKFCDANEFPYPFKNNTYDYVLLKQCLTLFDNPRKVLLELRRICKNEAIIEIRCAYYNNKGAYTDLDTKHWFNNQTFIKLCENNCRIDKKDLFRIKELMLIPTPIGKILPKFVREKLSLFTGGLISVINVKLEVIK